MNDETISGNQRENQLLIQQYAAKCRSELESSICHQIETFEYKTGLKVDNIDFDRLDIHGASSPVIIKIRAIIP